ncbi:MULTISPECIES: hypothetical protein [Streptomyces]|uniref:Uncharacterized protein n=3 Tax=Streptomyces TaxID=1883 RepID=A0A1I6V9H1_9ACTN|nr:MULTISPECIES: hypothetical protein [Streptomyces]SFT10418.1 hypothetical protein SAMN05444716_107226 [Streptomyces harbinensis]
MRRTVGTVALVVTLAATTAGTGHAAPAAAGPAGCVPEAALDPGTEAGADALLTLVDTLRAHGADDRAVDTELAARACLVRADTEPDVPGTDLIALDAPDVYVITTVDGRERWVAISAWQWQTVPGPPMHGAQAVATWFDGAIEPVLQVLHHSGTTPAYPSVSREDAAEVNAHGTGFLMTPRQNATDTDVATGRTALVFETAQDTCGPLTVRSAFAHTWHATSIDSLAVHAEGPAFGWTSTENRALALSPPTEVDVSC